MKKIKFFLVSFILFSSFASANEDVKIIKDAGSLPILAPSFAKRETLKMQLSNGLKVYLISDPYADISAAALSVDAGSWQDPSEYPGLAHFNEHMLFLGTKKFPVESAYDAYIKDHGGDTNAFTTATYTTFGFDIRNDALPEALDRFASFFKEPLFLESGVTRELNAVNQEYQKNIENDDARGFYVYKELMNPQHPEHFFNIGNNSTLKNVKTNQLKEWFGSHYSANIMQLVIYSNLPLNELKELAIKDFSDIPNTNKKPFSVDISPRNPAMEGKIVFVTPSKDLKRLSISWELSSQYAKMLEEKPEDVLCYILGNEGKNSLLAALRQEGLADTLSCSNYPRGKNLDLFLQLDLTDKGLKNYTLVVERIFQAIAYLKQHGIPKYIFDEVQDIEKVAYQYPSRDEPFQSVTKLTQYMKDEDLSSFPEKSQVIQKYDPEILKAVIDELTPQNAYIEIMAFPEMTGVKPDKKEKWLGIPYAVQDIPDHTFNSWKEAQPIANITIPDHNLFIPEEPKIVVKADPEKKQDALIPQPKTLVENALGILYYAPDDRYFAPEVSIGWIVRSREIDSGSKKAILADLYVKSLEDALNEIAYPAKIAGLDYKIERKDDWIQFSINGYSEKAPVLFEEIINRLKQPPTLERFYTIKETLQNDYQNKTLHATPFEKSIEILKGVIYDHYVSDNYKLKMIKSITHEDLTKYYVDLYKATYLEGVMYGNLTEDQAKDLWGKLNTALGSTTYHKTDWNTQKVAILPEEQGPFYLVKDVTTRGNVTLLAIEYDRYSSIDRAAHQILSQAIQPAFFAELRTKQQTGYMVFNTNQEIERRLFLFFVSESYTFDTRDLLARFELFLEQYLRKLKEDPGYQQTFETVKNSVITELSTPTRNTKDMGEMLETLAFKYDGDFNWMQKRLEGAKALTYDVFVSKAQDILGKVNKRRLAIMIQGNITDKNLLKYAKAKNLEWLRGEVKYVSRKQFLEDTEKKE